MTDSEVPQSEQQKQSAAKRPDRWFTEAIKERVDPTNTKAQEHSDLTPREAGNMNEHSYGTHLIKFKADRTPHGNYWIGKAHVQYNYGRILRCFEVHGPAEKFDSKEAAEHHVLSLAKTLIDNFI